MKFLQPYRQIINRNQRGFTVVELLLYMGIYSILLIILLQIFTSILSVHSESQATSSLDQNGNYILSRLSYDIHQASTVLTPTLGSIGTSLHITGIGKDLTYQVNGDNITLTDNLTGLTDQINSVDTSADVHFTKLGNTLSDSKSSVKIQLTIKSSVKRSGGIQQTETFDTTIGTR